MCVCTNPPSFIPPSTDPSFQSTFIQLFHQNPHSSRFHHVSCLHLRDVTASSLHTDLVCSSLTSEFIHQGCLHRSLLHFAFSAKPTPSVRPTCPHPPCPLRYVASLRVSDLAVDGFTLESVKSLARLTQTLKGTFGVHPGVKVLAQHHGAGFASTGPPSACSG